MRKFVQGLIGAALLATGTATLTAAPAAAQGYSIEIGPGGVEVNRNRGREYDRRYDPYCRAADCGIYVDRDRDRDRWDRDRDRWDRDRDRWDRDRDRDRWERPRRVSRESVARCAQRYRSYDPRTHTYVVNRRGDRAVCRL